MSIGVVYLARGKDPNWQKRLTRFRDSYLAFPAGITHELYAIFKEFTEQDLLTAMSELAIIQPYPILDFIDRNSYAGGSFLEATTKMKEDLACFLGSSSEIMHPDWLLKLYTALQQPTVGAVCCTGSYGFITEFNPQLTYPNPHMRNLSFLMDRDMYARLSGTIDWQEKPGPKLEDLNFEHGPNSLTRRIMAMGKTILVVEKDRVRAPHEWGDTTYRGNLHNVLIHDRGARDYHDL